MPERRGQHFAVGRTNVGNRQPVDEVAQRAVPSGLDGGLEIRHRRLAESLELTDAIEVEVEDVANVEKKVPPEYISEDGFGITEVCRRYLAPLIQGEAYPPYKDGLPDYVRLKNVAAAKKLATTFSI